MKTGAAHWNLAVKLPSFYISARVCTLENLGNEFSDWICMFLFLLLLAVVCGVARFLSMQEHSMLEEVLTISSLF